MRFLFDDILHEPDRTTKDKERCKQWPDYNAAWQYVDEIGYKEIIKKLKESYKTLSES